MLNYYNKFLSDISHVLAPLYLLLRKDTFWMWGIEQERAFEKTKELLTSLPILVHFDGAKDLFLECDASPYGLGAVIMHHIDGFYRPIAYASRALHDAESKYSQLEKEALAVIFGVRKFHSYLFGRQFTLISDHKPLLGLMSEERPVPVLAAGRIQRWALELSNYDYKMIHRSGISIQRADALSRLPLPDQPKSVSVPAEIVHLMDVLDDGPVTASQIQRWTRTDLQLSQVLRYVENGWPSQVNSSLRAYSMRASELGVQDGCLLWGNRVVVPSAGREALLKVLHQSHPGASQMKTLARSHFWWPGLDSEVEKLAKQCVRCQEMLQSPPAFPLQPWAWPDKPWSRIHIDYAGPVDGKMLLVIVDAHSKWLDVHITTSVTSSATIQNLRVSFSTHGLPDVLVSDNGPNLVSAEMEDFLRGNGIEHVRTAPYHPSSNGLAERAVKTLKHSLSKQGKGTLEVRLARFLLSYRVTPHATTGIAPCELLMGRKLRTLLDRVHPCVASRVICKQSHQKRHHDLRARFRRIAEGDKVLARDYARGGRWRQGRVERQFGASSYECRFNDGLLVRRHADQLRRLVDGGPTGRERGERSPSSREQQRLEPHEEPLQRDQVGGSPSRRYEGESEDEDERRGYRHGREMEESEPGPRESDHLQCQEPPSAGQMDQAERSHVRQLPGEAVESEVTLPRRSTRIRVKPERLVYS
jgi:transposase InsO family protein